MTKEEAERLRAEVAASRKRIKQLEKALRRTVAAAEAASSTGRHRSDSIFDVVSGAADLNDDEDEHFD